MLQYTHHNLSSILAMDMAESSPPSLHTHYLSKAQQAFCSRNPTYRAPIAELHTLRNELQQIRGLLVVQEEGKLRKSTRNSLKKNWRYSRRKRALQLRCEVEQESCAAEDALVTEEERPAYQELERRLLDWDDECALLAESLLCRPKACA